MNDLITRHKKIKLNGETILKKKNKRLNLLFSKLSNVVSIILIFELSINLASD